MIDRRRCAFALTFEENCHTRCYRPAGHNAKHKARKWSKNPYEFVEWYQHDSREFLSTMERAYAWRAKRKKSAAPGPSSSESRSTPAVNDPFMSWQKRMKVED